MDLTPQDFAARLNGRQYLGEISGAEAQEAKAAGLVVVFGASDDVVEFAGAIDEELGAYGGGSWEVDRKGLIPDFDDLIDRSRSADIKNNLRDYFQRENGGVAVTAKWDSDGYSWVIETDIPHATFDIMEDVDKFCRGIVFRLADAAPQARTVTVAPGITREMRP